MKTLLDLIEHIKRLDKKEAVEWSNGLRTWVWTYADLHDRICAVGRWLESRGIRKHDRIMIWGENRPEWLAAFWGAVACGVEVVPVDFRFSVDLITRIQRESQPKLLVHGDSVNAALEIERIDFKGIAELPQGDLPPAAVTADDIVEIVYTSGTTGEPKGVVHRHRNICANLEPFKREIEKYQRWAAPFQPIRMLNLLPLSHMFGQSQGLFIPPILGGSVVFTEEIRPAAIIRMTQKQHISVIVSVPRILETLKHEVERRFEIAPAPSAKGWLGVITRWWRYRKIHTAFGWKFWAFVVGGARIDPELEEFWGKLGYAVVQGYGLTEASPVVAVNHPFNAKRGSLGKVVPGQDVMIAPDGEIMVRGESVTGERGQWLSTGDLGEIDGEGRLYYRGRKKDMIVTAEGLNVHPEDVEAVLRSFPEVRDSAVIAAQSNGSELVHAALILADPSADPSTIVSRANARLESHQRIRGWTIWPEDDFPRTASTMKVKRHEVARRLAAGASSTPRPAAVLSPLDELLARKPEARLDEDLGLSSLERVELLSEMESRLGVDLDEDAFSKIKTVSELSALSAQSGPPGSQDSLSNWPNSVPARLFRFFMQRALVLPLFRHYIPDTVIGLEHLAELAPPVIFAANHTSNLDTIAIVDALPAQWRRRLAPAMSKDHFRAWFEGRNIGLGIQYWLARSVFNAYPLPQEMSGVKRALHYTGELVEAGLCPLVYPEGARTPDGEMKKFRPGIGMMALRLRVPVVPVHIAGLFDVYSVHHSWPRRGPVRVTFGTPLRFGAHDTIESATAAIEAAVRKLSKS